MAKSKEELLEELIDRNDLSIMKRQVRHAYLKEKMDAENNKDNKKALQGMMGQETAEIANLEAYGDFLKKFKVEK